MTERRAFVPAIGRLVIFHSGHEENQVRHMMVVSLLRPVRRGALAAEDRGL
jgi:hypothetical protein